MRAVVTASGQVLIPITIRRRLGLGPQSAVDWVLEGGTARLIPVPSTRAEPLPAEPARPRPTAPVISRPRR